MTTASAPILGGSALPVPKEQPFKRFYRGGTLQMADGSIVHDLVDNTARHSFRLRWEFITYAQVILIQTAWDGIKNATATYQSVLGVSYTVTQADGAELEMTPVVTGGGDVKFHVALELVEDS